MIDYSKLLTDPCQAAAFLEEDYFSLPLISNSDLSNFRELLFFGRQRELPRMACNFGEVFHQLLLEPHLPTPEYEKIDYRLIEKLVDKISREELVKEFLQKGVKERVILFTDPCSMAHCRTKIDLQLDKVVIDFKTTYERSQEGFEKALIALNYDKQAAFYMDSVEAVNFIFVGVQKQSPFRIYYFDCSKHPAFIQGGRKKYKKLLKEYVSYYKLADNNYFKWPKVAELMEAI